jgi:serine/threonine-protein kinase
MASERPAEPLAPGARLGKYEIIRRVAEGGMAVIYLAKSPGPDGFSKPVALKVMRPEFSERAEMTRMLIQEAKVAAALNHPSIVQVFDFGRVEHEYYLTMEWIDGISLNRLLAHVVREQRSLSIGTVAQIGLSIAEALSYLQNGVDLEEGHVSLVHRDVTPSNVLISNSGAIKLTDFGIVKVLEAPSVTKIGVVKGKYAYMSPEQLRGNVVDHRSDIFALGVILYEMATLRRLFRRKTLAATIAAVHAARVPRPSSVRADVPAELDWIILRALAKDPNARYASAQEMVDDLWAILSAYPRTGTSELIDMVRAVSADVALGRRVPRDEISVDGTIDSDEGAGGTEDEFEELEMLELDAISVSNSNVEAVWDSASSNVQGSARPEKTRVTPLQSLPPDPPSHQRRDRYIAAGHRRQSSLLADRSRVNRRDPNLRRDPL